VFFATSAISYLRGETIAVVSSIVMSLLFILLYITFKIMSRKNILPDMRATKDEAMY
jgi:heme exporter protein D